MENITITHPKTDRQALIHSMHKALRIAGHATDKMELEYEMVVKEIENGKYRASFTNEYAEVFVICTPAGNAYKVAAPQINKIKEIPPAVLANTITYNPNEE